MMKTEPKTRIFLVALLALISSSCLALPTAAVADGGSARATAPAAAESTEWRTAGGWNARRGDSLVDVLVDWAQADGWNVIVETSGSWVFDVPYQSDGTFREAVEEVLSGFSSSAFAPYVTFYSNNTMVIGGDL